MLSLLLCFGVFFKDLLPLQQHAVKCLRNIAKNIQRGDICLEKYNGILLETSIWETVIHHIIILPTQTFRRKKTEKDVADVYLYYYCKMEISTAGYLISIAASF